MTANKIRSSAAWSRICVCATEKSDDERTCVGAFLLRGTDVPRLLLGKCAADRPFYLDVWGVPGWHCEPGETLDQGLARELREEIGITQTIWQPLGELRAAAPGSDETAVLHLYVVTAWTGNPHNRQTEEHAEVAWLTALRAL